MSAEPTEDTLFAMIIGYVASALSIFFFISPILLFKEAFESKNLCKIPFFMLLFNSLNCLFWIVYGFYLHQNPMWVCNTIGLTFNITWLVCYSLIFFREELVLKVSTSGVYIILALGGILFGIYLFILEDEEKTHFALVADICGYIACINNVFMYLGPGQNLREVYKTGNYNLIPIWSSIIGWISCFFWALYSLIDKTAVIKGIDIPCFVPNILGFIFMPVQIIFWVYFSRKAKREGYYFDNQLNKVQIEDSGNQSLTTKENSCA